VNLFSLTFPGITLIEVPYWWDRKYESLQATVYSQRPDLFYEKPTGKPIPIVVPAPQPTLSDKSNINMGNNLTCYRFVEEYFNDSN
jgi:hypothetical protein